MKLSTIFWVALAWATIGLLHALSRYSDMVKYNAQTSFSFTDMFMFILVYSMWIFITLVLMRSIRAITAPNTAAKLSALFIVGLVCWLPLYFALEFALTNWIAGGDFAQWFEKFINIGGSLVFFYAIIYGLTFAACFAVTLSDRNRQTQQMNMALRQQQTEIALQLSEHKIQLIQSQLSPHFLFNCLSAISSLARNNSRDELISAIAMIGNLLRFTIANAASKLITLDEELAFTRDYVALQKLRFEDRFVCTFCVNEYDSDILCPPFTVQLLLENAFTHAVEKTKDNVKISLSVTQKNKDVLIAVTNTSGGLQSPDQNSSKGNGIGLSNLKARLKHVYRDQFSFNSHSKNDAFEVLLQIPIGLSSNEF